MQQTFVAVWRFAVADGARGGASAQETLFVIGQAVAISVIARIAAGYNLQAGFVYQKRISFFAGCLDYRGPVTL